MKLGIFMMPLHPPSRPMHETLEEDVEKAVLADRLGFDEVWVGEHFSASTEPVSAPLMFLASLVHQTKRVRFGTGVISMPCHHPAVVAAEVAQFDHLSRGRYIFGVGQGGLASDHELFGGQDGKLRTEKLIESVDMVLEIWRQNPPYKIDGKFWNVEIKDAIVSELGIGHMPKPYQQPHPEIVTSVMSPFSSSVTMAATKGWSPISANFTPEYSVASHWTKYLQDCAKLGKTADGNRWRVARNIIVAPTDAEARDRAIDPAGSNHYYFSYLWKTLVLAKYTIVMKPKPDMADESVTTEQIIDDLVIYGSPKTVLDKLVAFRERVGPFGTLLIAGMDWSGVNRAREQESMRLLTEQVMPKFGAAVGSKVPEPA